jgi:FKBP-type peptidyl-prolyl cis-trans isomerase
MNKTLIILSLVLLASCGPSAEEKRQVEMEQQRLEQEASEKLAQGKAKRIAAVTCSIMAETRNMDAAIRVEKMNEAREKVGGEPFLDGDEKIKESLEYGLCQELVLNEFYSEELQSTKDAIRKREQITAEKLAKAIKAEAKAREAKLEAERLKAEGVLRKKVEKYLSGATFTKSGLAYQIVEQGSGPKPSLDNTVEVHYVGRFLDGTEFDSSVKRGTPAQFGVTQVIPGWTEVLQLMPEGSKWKVYVRAGLAYGVSGTGPIGPNKDLLFEIELIRSNVD